MLRLVPIRFRAAALPLAMWSAACASQRPEQAAAPHTTAAPVARADPDEGIDRSSDADQCPDHPGDRDKFEDVDGCPDPDPPQAISELTLPAAACVLATEHWDGTAPITELRLAPGGPAYALITAPSARLHLAVGPSSAGSAVEVEDGGVALRGFVKSGAFALHPAKPLVLGGFAIPSAFAALSFTEARDGQVSIGYDIGPGVEVLAPLAASAPCSDLSLDVASFEPADAIGDIDNGKFEQLRLGHAIDLRAEPGGKILARLRAKDDDDSLVKVLSSSGRSKRILWSRDTALVFGWVAASELRSRSIGLTGIGTGRGRPALPKSSKILEVLRCERDVALFAEAEGQRAKVGSAKSGTVLEVLSRAHDFDSVQTPSRKIAGAPNARLLASARDLSSCAPERERADSK